jgi:hypothetical protein
MVTRYFVLDMELGLAALKRPDCTLLTHYYTSEREARRGHQELCHFLAGAMRKLI